MALIDGFALATLMAEMVERICASFAHAISRLSMHDQGVSGLSQTRRFVLEIDVIHRGTSRDTRRICASLNAILLDPYNLAQFVS